jgi:hypothetical protein
MTKTLNQLYQEHRDNQLSPILLSLLREPVDVTINTFTRIATILQLIDAIEKLGWTEHTSDWDLGATITLKSGKQIGVLQGYAGNLYLGYKNYIQLSLKDDYISELSEHDPIYLHFDGSDTEDDLIPFKIPIENIKSISVYD